MAQTLNQKIIASDLPPLDKEWLVYFLETYSAERGLAALSLAAYRDDLLQFLFYLQRKKITPGKVGVRDASDYLLHLVSAENIGKSSQARKLSALRQFYNFLWREKYIADNPFAEIENPKIPRALPKTMSVDDAAKLLATIDNLEKKEQARLKAMVELLYAAGLRVSEMLALPVAAIDLEKKIIRVMGKGAKERFVIINSSAVTAVDDYLAVREFFLPRGDKNKESAFLFPSSGGRGAVSESGHVTRQRFSQLLKDLARAANLDEKNISPHVLRHAFACHLLAGGTDVRSLQLLLGHSHIATTEIYTHLDLAQKKKLVLEKHPLAK
ncbi:MAG: tyrosine recombinase [Hydrotalea sp.]|nr:tyrosine recombinase [Hydrotalea sp.]